MEIAIILFVLAVCGAFSSFIASQKNRNTGGWLLLGFLFGILALIAIAAVPALAEDEVEQPLLATDEEAEPPPSAIAAILGLFALGAICYVATQLFFFD